MSHSTSHASVKAQDSQKRFEQERKKKEREMTIFYYNKKIYKNMNYIVFAKDSSVKP